jgi:hypothetical protein
MARLTDPERLEAYRDALKNWRFEGYIELAMPDQSYDWMREKLGNIRVQELFRLMHEYVETGGEIDEVRETRPEWASDYEYHYDLRFTVQGVPVYVETRLRYRPPFVSDEPTIIMVNVHAP